MTNDFDELIEKNKNLILDNKRLIEAKQTLINSNNILSPMKF